MTRNWLKYCFYGSSLCCNNIINGMGARKRITSEDIEKVINYNINSERICNETELIKDIDESPKPKNMTYEEYLKKTKGEIENKYVSFWKNNNLISDDKFTNKTHNFTTNIVEMSDKIKEEDKSNKEASELKEEDKKNKKASEVKEVIDKNSLKYIEENILKLGSANCNKYKFLNIKQKKDNFKLEIKVEEIDLNKILNKENDFKIEIKATEMKDNLEKQINDLKKYILKSTNSCNLNIDLNFDKNLTYKTQINLNNINSFKDDSDSYEDIRYIESK